MRFAFRAVRERSLLLRTIDRKYDGYRAGPLRRAVIDRRDRDIDLLASLDVIRPSAFEYAITAAIEVRVLCEMVERVGRAVEAGRDVVPASSVVSRSLPPAEAWALLDRCGSDASDSVPVIDIVLLSVQRVGIAVADDDVIP